MTVGHVPSPDGFFQPVCQWLDWHQLPHRCRSSSITFPWTRSTKLNMISSTTRRHVSKSCCVKSRKGSALYFVTVPNLSPGLKGIISFELASISYAAEVSLRLNYEVGSGVGLINTLAAVPGLVARGQRQRRAVLLLTHDACYEVGNIFIKYHSLYVLWPPT